MSVVEEEKETDQTVFDGNMVVISEGNFEEKVNNTGESTPDEKPRKTIYEVIGGEYFEESKVSLLIF